MSGFFQDLLQGAAAGLFGSATIKDYSHASKTFRPDSYANAPKHKFLFHTVFTLSDGVFTGDQNNFGILVRDVKLPSYQFDTHKMNQYNRKRIVQTKIRYEPVQISFHDDNANTINKLWYSYYTYYYKDATKPGVFFDGNRGGQQGPTDPNATATQPTLANYDYRDIYEKTITGNDDWGYIGETAAPGTVDGNKPPFFKDIRIFGFWQHNWTAYVLVNPIITSFNHDTYDYNEGNGVMKNQMTIEYETVVYNEGALDGREPSDIVTGFGLESNYDREKSPLGSLGSNGKILGKGGLIDSAGGAVKGMLSGENVLGNALKLGQIAYNNKDKNLKQNVKLELQQALSSAITNPNVTRNVPAQYPSTGGTPQPLNTAGAPTTGAAQAPQKIGTTQTAGKQVTSGPTPTPRGRAGTGG
jgi:hypothetical protein